ncbi:DUF6218 family protein [Umezawaea endophytica]|uniref:DUF6218 family protein n=1 Tax=Umezawaea endophytica TaxID=1654476 RepID=A0A9X3A367_9PSEU|nr:DUF6218 family protein [Umezawaea endophytica]MCS7479818.1 DUF6218 family protein [Umezawaea endophytica]
MTTGTQEELLTTRAADGRALIGHVVVCRAGGEVAVAHLGADGVTTGEWVAPVGESLLERCEGRALLAWDAAEAVAVVREWALADGATDVNLVTVTLSEALTEVAEARAGYAAVVAEKQAARLESGDLRWPVTLPDPLPATLEDLRRRARVVVPSDVSEAVAQARLICGLGEWVVRRWQENAVALSRREYLRAEFGEPSVLAPRWEERLAGA